jgi:putative nucleotidyltransferase with HDIG domain
VEQLKSLRKIDSTITSSLDIKTSLSVILKELKDRLEVNAASVLLYDDDLKELSYGHGIGFHTRVTPHTHIRLGDELAGQVALEDKPLFISDLDQDENNHLYTHNLSLEGFVSYYGIPLRAKGKLVGVLEVFQRTRLKPDQNWIDYAEILAKQTAIAIDNLSMFSELKRASQNMILAYDATIEGWARALEIRDQETEGHSRRVTDLTMRIAREYDLPREDLVHIRRGALLHDIGKMGVPNSILFKPGPLEEEEWDIMRKHPLYAQEILKGIHFLEPALDIPLYHHERWDGSGYPEGLKETDIPLPARIFAVVDVWDALRSDRPYREAWSDGKALQYIKDQAGTLFDPKVVWKFLEITQSR